MPRLIIFILVTFLLISSTQDVFAQNIGQPTNIVSCMGMIFLLSDEARKKNRTESSLIPLKPIAQRMIEHCQEQQFAQAYQLYLDMKATLQDQKIIQN